MTNSPSFSAIVGSEISTIDADSRSSSLIETVTEFLLPIVPFPSATSVIVYTTESEPSASVSETAAIVILALDDPAGIVIGSTVGKVNSPLTDSVAS